MCIFEKGSRHLSFALNTARGCKLAGPLSVILMFKVFPQNE